jgi:hypothetical protein
MTALTSIPESTMSQDHSPHTLAERLHSIALEDRPPPSSISMPQTASPQTGIYSPGVLDNGTNIGSSMGRKASIAAHGSFSGQERKQSVGGSPSGRASRRGSGSVMTPSGTHVVYHTRTNVSMVCVALMCPG